MTMVDVRAIGARYSQLLCAYVADQGEHSLAELAELGREALKIGLPPEEIGDIHQTALLGLAREHPEMAIRDAAEFTSAPLVELLMAYGLAFREQAAKRESLMKDLTAREQLYRQMFMSNQALQLLINPDSWSIVDVNPAACAFYGYAVEELKNMKLSNIFADEPDRLQEILLSADDGGPTHFGRRQRLRSGAIRNVEIFPSNVTVRDRQLLYWIVHDITERKKAEDTIRSMAQTDFLPACQTAASFTIV